MDTVKIEDIFKEWQKKDLLTKKGALRADPNFVYAFRMAFGTPGILLAGIFYMLLFLAFFCLFFLVPSELGFWLSDLLHLGKDGGVIFYFLFILVIWGGLPFLILIVFGARTIKLFSVHTKLFAAFETVLYFCFEPLILPFLCYKPIHLFHKDHLVVSSGWIGPKEKCYYSDIEKITYSCLDKKEFRLRILLKGREKPVELKDSPKLGDVLHLLGSAFQPIFVNEPLCEDMLRLYADMITLGRDPKSQQDGLQCAMKYFSEPKYKDYDYTRRLTELVDTFNHYRAQKRMPRSEDYINRCLSILKNKGVDYDGRLALLSHLFECAYASEEMVDVVELDRLSRIAYYFRIREWDFLSLKYSFEAMKQQRGRRNGTENAQQRERYQSAYSNRLKEAYKILGLDEKATLDEVKSAYRTQVKTCHPDTLPPTATETEREEASIRFRTITEAYDFLCEELVVEPVSVTR
jgi:DnaJ-class molecular chaperone with C-terminal Zn finger domain